MGDALGKDAPKKAAETGAAAAREASASQRQSAQEALAFSKDILSTEIERDLYGRAFAERGFDVGLEQYRDQHALQQAQFGAQQQQLGLGNSIREQALNNLQQFTNVGLGSLGKLSQMTGGSGAGLSGPVPLNQAAQSFAPPQLQQSLPQSQAPSYIGTTESRINQPIAEQRPSFLSRVGINPEVSASVETESQITVEEARRAASAINGIKGPNPEGTSERVSLLADIYADIGIDRTRLESDRDLYVKSQQYILGMMSREDFASYLESRGLS